MDKCRISFHVLSLLYISWGRHCSETGIWMSVLLKVHVPHSQHCLWEGWPVELPQEVRKHVVWGVTQSYWNETGHVACQWNRMIIWISVNSHGSPGHFDLWRQTWEVTGSSRPKEFLWFGRLVSQTLSIFFQPPLSVLLLEPWVRQSAFLSLPLFDCSPIYHKAEVPDTMHSLIHSFSGRSACSENEKD